MSGPWESTPLSRANLVQEDLVVYPIPFSLFRVHDNIAANLPAAGAADDLGLVNNTYLTDTPTLESQDNKAATQSNLARVEYPIPAEYVPGQSITLKINAGMLTTISDDTATLDVECVRKAAPSVDLYAGAVVNINSITAADFTFVIVPTNVVVGDVLDIRLTTAIVDAATGTAVIAQLNQVDLLLDIKG